MTADLTVTPAAASPDLAKLADLAVGAQAIIDDWYLQTFTEKWPGDALGAAMRKTTSENRVAYIAALSPDVVLTLIHRLRAAESALGNLRLSVWHADYCAADDLGHCICGLTAAIVAADKVLEARHAD